MRQAIAVTLLVLAATSAGAADPVFLDQLMEMPLATLQRQFPTLRTEGCYALPDGRYMQITIDRKEQKPWRVTFTSEVPCRRPEPGPALDLRARSGVVLGDTSIAIIERLGRPDASAPPEEKLRRLGDTEYFFICRVSVGCARHTSVYVKSGVVTAISEWYSE